MPTSNLLPSFNRRQWFKTSGAALAGLALSSRFLDSDLCAQTVSPERLAAVAPSKARLSLNENPLGPSPAAAAAIAACMAGGKASRYPYLEVGELTKLLAEKEGVTPEHILLSVGSGEILEKIGVQVGRAKQEVVYGEPGYLQLVAMAKAMGGVAVPVPLNAKLEHDLGAMAAKVGANTGVVYLANPNNPTGTVVDSGALREFVRSVGPKTLVIVDEAYLDIADNYAARTVVDLVAQGHNLIVLRTFSKIFGLAGVRVGYGVAAPKLIAQLRSTGGGSISSLGVAAAIASVQEKTYVAATRAKIVHERDQLLAALKELGLGYAEPQGNFVFFKTGRPYQGVADQFRAASVSVARAFPPLTEWVRLSIGLPEENALARATLRKIFAA